jgi:hypothetical protein
VSTVEAEVFEKRRRKPLSGYASAETRVYSPATMPEVGWATYTYDRVPLSGRTHHRASSISDYGVVIRTVGESYPVSAPHRGTFVVVTTDDENQGNPFEEFVRSKVRAAHAAIDTWVSEKNADPALARRIADLVDMAAEEYPDTEIPSRHVLDNVFGFFRTGAALRRPLLALTSPGGVWAEWHVDETHTAALEFRRNGLVNLAAFYPDPNDPLAVAALTVSFGWKSAARHVHNNPALRWLFTP